MMDVNHASDRPAVLAAAVIMWGSTAYGYINTGFSIAMIVFALYFLWTRYKKEPLPCWPLDRRMLWAFGILYAALLFTTLFHLDNMKNLSGGYFSALGFIQYTFPLWMLLYIGWTRDLRKVLCGTFYIILYAFCIFGLVKYVMLGETRLSSFYGFPTRIGMLLDMFIPMTAAFMAYYWENVRFRYASMLLLALEMICMVLAEVRGSMLAMSIAVVAVAALWMVQNRERLSKRARMVVAAAVILFVAAAAVYAVGLRWGNPSAMLGGERFMMWESSFHMWMDHPFAGIGLNEWQAAYAEGPYHPAASREAGQVMPHNVFVYFFATAGTVGGLAYVAYCALMLAWLTDQTKKQAANPFAWAMLFLFIAATAHGLVDQTFILKLTGRVFYMLLGIGILFLRTGEAGQIGEKIYGRK